MDRQPKTGRRTPSGQSRRENEKKRKKKPPLFIVSHWRLKSSACQCRRTPPLIPFLFREFVRGDLTSTVPSIPWSWYDHFFFSDYSASISISSRSAETLPFSFASVAQRPTHANRRSSDYRIQSAGGTGKKIPGKRFRGCFSCPKAGPD